MDNPFFEWTILLLIFASSLSLCFEDINLQDNEEVSILRFPNLPNFYMETFSQKNNNFFLLSLPLPLWQHHSANVYSENRQLGVCGAFLHRDDTQVDSFRPVAILHKCLDLPWFYHRLCKSLFICMAHSTRYREYCW